MSVLLTREQFREGVLKRDGHQCVLCKAKDTKLDAHHIMERRLWPDGGYYLDNGVSVCEPCHLRCESTEISTQALRDLVGIKTVLLPPSLYRDQEYDKWGNPILSDGRRLRGGLAEDISVLKVLAQCNPPVEFSHRMKYPRTWHLPWSPGPTKDDRVLPNVSHFEGREVVVTIKMDGENTSLYSDGIHARSLDYTPHVSRDWVKAKWSQICGDIPEGWRICAENLFAQHTLFYDDLPTYLMVFSIWDGLTALSWKDTLDWCNLLDLQPVPVLYQGKFDAQAIQDLKLDLETNEGYVVRLADSFHYRDFDKSVAKFVRAGHVAGSHWKSRSIIQNQLAR